MKLKIRDNLRKRENEGDNENFEVTGDDKIMNEREEVKMKS